MAKVVLLVPPVDPRYQAMTFPAYRHLLELHTAHRHPDSHEGPLVQPIAAGALDEGRPVGLALVELPFDDQGAEPELLSVFVVSSHRGRGIATSLVTRMQETVAGLGYARVHTTYMTGKPGIPAFQQVLWHCGWEPPVTRTVTLKMTVEETYEVPWLEKVRLPRGYETFLWAELGAEEREALKRSQEERHWIAEDLQPWDFDRHGFEPLTSVGLRGPDGVVGWVINHEISPAMVRFTCSFIRKDLGRRARILPLYAESIRRLRESPYSSFCFVSPLAHPNMAAFARRRIGPWAGFCAETRGSTKVLRPHPEKEEENRCE